MASIIKKTTSRFYLAAFRDADGKQVRKTTGQVDPKKAQRAADLFERVSKREGSVERMRASFEALIQEYYHQETPRAGVRAFVTGWLESRRREISLATIKVYENTCKRFLEFLGADADKELEFVNKTRLVQFRDKLSDKLAVATCNRDLTIIKMIFRQARIDGYLQNDPSEGVTVLKNREMQKPRRPLTMDEIRSILIVADPEWQSMIKFGLFSGQRLGDIASLTWNQVDIARGELHLTTQKTGKRILLPIVGQLLLHIEALPSSDNPGAPLHPRAYGTMQAQGGRSGSLSNQFAELMVQAGLRESPARRTAGNGRSAKREGSDVSYHSLRHSAVSMMKDAGVPDSVVMALVGHNSAAMSQRYTSVGMSSLEKAQMSMPKL